MISGEYTEHKILKLSILGNKLLTLKYKILRKELLAWTYDDLKANSDSLIEETFGSEGMFPGSDSGIKNFFGRLDY